MRISPIILVLVALLSQHAVASESASDKPEWRYSQASDLYKAENYDSAAAIYQTLINEGTQAFELYYNAGNAYYKSGELGKAILNYEKARKIDRRKADVQYNLELAYLRQPDREPDAIPLNIFGKTWRGITGIMSSGEWSMSTIVLWWLALSGIVIYWFINRVYLKKAGFFMFLVALGLGILTLIFSIGKRGIEKHDQHAIIMSPSAVIKSAPSHEATDLYILREGFKLRVTDKAGTWTKVMLTDGNTGWMEEKALEDI
ncbi:MAG: hypothetical protein ACI959_000923 [Limisphaerales bacterium]|jgi:hypothetical protein